MSQVTPGIVRLLANDNKFCLTFQSLFLRHFIDIIEFLKFYAESIVVDVKFLAGFKRTKEPVWLNICLLSQHL